MKLVQILARELVLWSNTTEFYCQDDCGQVYPWIGKPEIRNGEWEAVVMKAKVDQSTKAGSVYCRIASDQSTAIVTRADWEAERARIAGIEVVQKASAANKDGWIRHRGGKRPVADDVLVDVRFRNGDTETGKKWPRWDHSFHDRDIMAYRPHKPAEQVEPFIEAVQAFNALSKVPQLDGPFGWRDRITEIDDTTQALSAERAELVQKLASEGFALIGRSVEPVEDMSDPKNWRAGDMLIAKGDAHGQFTQGGMYEIKDVGKESVSIAVDDSGSKTNGWGLQNWEWRSRPSA